MSLDTNNANNPIITNTIPNTNANAVGITAGTPLKELHNKVSSDIKIKIRPLRMAIGQSWNVSVGCVRRSTYGENFVIINGAASIVSIINMSQAMAPKVKTK